MLELPSFRIIVKKDAKGNIGWLAMIGSAVLTMGKVTFGLSEG
jgi:hypothetical protein